MTTSSGAYGGGSAGGSDYAACLGGQAGCRRIVDEYTKGSIRRVQYQRNAATYEAQLPPDASLPAPGYDLERAYCWCWTGATTNTGYGSVKRLPLGHTGPTRNAGKNFLLHRIAYIARTGQNPASGQVVSHRCRNNLCFNPWHVTAEPQQTNVGRNTCTGVIVCRHGHRIVDACAHNPSCIWQRVYGQAIACRCSWRPTPIPGSSPPLPGQSPTPVDRLSEDLLDLRSSSPIPWSSSPIRATHTAAQELRVRINNPTQEPRIHNHPAAQWVRAEASRQHVPVSHLNLSTFDQAFLETIGSDAFEDEISD